uniref:EF-hand domain-containing protein n=1 Tax=Eutreptiella gymnastica TaxID=73025 RepID=A0A7S1J2T4_9EUGL
MSALPSFAPTPWVATTAATTTTTTTTAATPPAPETEEKTYYGAGGAQSTYVTVREDDPVGGKKKISTYHLAQAAFDRYERNQPRKMAPKMCHHNQAIMDNYGDGQVTFLPQGRSEPYKYKDHSRPEAAHEPVKIKPGNVYPPSGNVHRLPAGPTPAAPVDTWTEPEQPAPGMPKWRPPPRVEAPKPPAMPRIWQPPAEPVAPEAPPAPAKVPSLHMERTTEIQPAETTITTDPTTGAYHKVTKSSFHASGKSSWGSMAAGAATQLEKKPSTGRIPSMGRMPSMGHLPSMKAKVPSLQAMPVHQEATPIPEAAVSPRTGVALAAFRMYDIDGSGELDVHEFHKAMQEMGMGYSFEDAENLFLMIDEDGSGVLSLQEFMEHCREYLKDGAGAGPLSEEQAEAEARKAFVRYDTDGNGFLDVNEFLQAIKDLGLGTSMEDAEALFSMADDDGNGTMEMEEFVMHCVDAIRNGMTFRGPPPPGAKLKSRHSLIVKGSLQPTGDPVLDAKTTFKKFDIDDSGYLDIYEFMSAMKELGLGFTFADASALFSEIDTDGDGTMDCNEFTQHYLKYCSQ